MEKRTTVIYESPHRLIKLIEELFEVCGEERPLQIARELTKYHEEQIGPTIKSALEYFKENKPRGEFTIVLGGFIQKQPNDVSTEKLKLLEEMQKLIKNGESASQSAKQISLKSGYSRRFLYTLLHNELNEEKS